MAIEILGDPRCEQCRKKKVMFTEVKLFGKKRRVCPECARSLGALFSHRVAEIVGGREGLLQDLKDMAEC